MKGRVALIVGCNDYVHLSPLFGASNDAFRFHEALISGTAGAYEEATSKLLLSPNLDQFRSALEAVLFQPDDIEVFTFYFAGHGGVKGGSYYLCLRETMVERMSTTAFPLNALFTVLNESRPAQINVIIDACNAGGLVGDLSTLLKPEVLGARGSPSISLLAAASADEYASETAEGGVVTRLILDYVTGRKRMNATSPYLDLSDIGRHISQEIDVEHGQTPTSWGLNLYGQPQFTKNPYYSASPSLIDTLPGIAPGSAVGQKISKHTEAIWDEYRSLAEEPDAYRLANTLRPIVEELADDAGSVAAFINGLAGTFEQQAAKSKDVFAAVTVVSVLPILLFELIEHDVIKATVTRLLRRRRELLLHAMEWIKARNAAERYYLISGGESSADLFLLPVRITKVLGHLWGQLLLDKLAGSVEVSLAADMGRLTDGMFDFYAKSFVAIADEQAPYLYLFAKAASEHGHSGIVRKIFDAMFSDLVGRKGNVADAHIDPSQILRFLILRQAGEERRAPDLLANPSQLLAAVLATGAAQSADGEWDKRLRALDHSAFVIFLPASHKQFGSEVIRDGVNNVFQVGHGIWCLSDFRREFEAECTPALLSDPSWRDPLVASLAIVSSLIFPDRIPWFLEAWK